jgi:ribosomal protein S18 acetylase RimI-like enzyme
MTILDLQFATPADAPELARMNRQLIEDEGSRNPMSLTALESRMRQWLQEDWRVVLIYAESTLAGYALFRVRLDDYFPQQSDVYVRQFFIRREWRKRGIGRTAFDLLMRDFFPPDATLTLDVLANNPAGQRFWQGLGFQPYSFTLKRPARSE